MCLKENNVDMHGSQPRRESVEYSITFGMEERCNSLKEMTFENVISLGRREAFRAHNGPLSW
jgi:hypothetical protein